MQALSALGFVGRAICAALILMSPGVSVASAAPRPLLLDGLFQDHAVFQRGRPIPVWGRAEPGEEIMLRLAGATATVRADEAGRWSVELPAMPAGGPFQLTVTSSGGARQTIADLLVGDVWLCSGQSNMEMGVDRALNAPTEIARAGDDAVRMLTVGHDTGFTPLAEFKTPVRWQAASPASVADFSAACYFMARDLRASQQVPIGLIDASWGGTAIDAWRSEAAIERGGGDLAERLAIFRAYRTDPAEGNRRWGAVWERWWRDRSSDEPWNDAAAVGWTPAPRLTNWESWGDPALADFNGLVWYRTTVTLTPEEAAQPATLTMGWIDDSDQTWVNGVPVGSSYGPSSGRSYGIPAGVLKAGENRVTVAVLDVYGGGGMTGPEELRAIHFDDGGSVPLGGSWSYRIAPSSYRWPPRSPWESHSGLTTIYNGMIAPLGRYGLRGVAWYQGESDAGAADGYAEKLASMMADWRGQFGQPELPFLIVQLAGWGPPNATPVESGFARIRDEQRRAVAADPNAALVVAIDLGDRVDIHPANKQDVGHRLARAARHIAYGEPVSPSGPEAASARRVDDRIEVAFENVEGALIAYSAGRPIGFELCGDAPGSCRFVQASIEGTKVVVDPAGGPADRVRFCWGESPICNLYDGSGLPAGPFEIEVR